MLMPFSCSKTQITQFLIHLNLIKNAIIISLHRYDTPGECLYSYLPGQNVLNGPNLGAEVAQIYLLKGSTVLRRFHDVASKRITAIRPTWFLQQ
jgi:hypothetical protein